MIVLLKDNILYFMATSVFQEDSPMTGSKSIGILLRTIHGEVIHASGLAASKEMQWRIAFALERTHQHVEVLQLEGEPPFILAIAGDDSMQVVLIRKAEGVEPLFDFLRTVPFASAVLNHILASPYEAISVVDANGIVKFLSPMHERWLGLRHGEAVGKPSRLVIPNSRLEQVAVSGNAEIGHLYSPDGISTRVVNRVPIKAAGKVVGALGRVIFKGPEIVQRMHNELVLLREEVQHYRNIHKNMSEESPLNIIIGDSAPVLKLKKEITQIADLDVPVLILGESGTGKELIARALHQLSNRKNHELVSLNIAALPSSLLEAELFGYAGGAFTGGLKSGRLGKFEVADKGTIFLDEVGDIPLDMQVKLLRVLEDQVVVRIADNTNRKIDFRLISATHRNISDMVKQGKFRLDLFYRIGGITISVPPLRERLEDIPNLLYYFVNSFCIKNKRSMPKINSDVSAMLASKKWEGNIRELRHKIEEALVFCNEEHLSVTHFRFIDDIANINHNSSLLEFSENPNNNMLESQKKWAHKILKECDGNKSLTAKKLGISRSFLYKLLS